MNRWLAVVFCMLVAALAGSACSGKEAVKDPVTLTVLSGSGSTEFNKAYGDIFRQKYPHVTLRVINYTQHEAYKTMDDLTKVMNDVQPDIVELYSSQLVDLVDKGQLVELDSYIQSSSFDIENMYAPVIEALRLYGEGRLYGLTPYFPGSALYYNKTLFDLNQIPVPSVGVTWEQIIDTAKLFPPNEGYVGTYIRKAPANKFNYISYIGLENGLREMDSTGKRVTVDTESWRTIWAKGIEAFQSGAIAEVASEPFPQSFSEDEYIELWLKNNAFAAGKAAMVVAGYGMAEQLELIGNSQSPNKPDFEWDIAAYIPNGSKPSGAFISDMNKIFSITTYSKNVQDAWELLSFMHSESAMLSLNNQQDLGYGYLSSRPSAARKIGDKNIGAFYSAAEAVNSGGAAKVPDAFLLSFMKIGEEEIELAISGEQTVEQSIANIQERGQQALEAALLAEGESEQ
ncbi:ABC transporter substrate-binding protein [Paenibacillus pinisoli]|nr:extracellular solute-binding protein [Paenibacillus pinisoli]